ncbi:S9 family peptidase [Lysobacter sp. TY2-98]|uniref:alpha/beta hydrolase family protein n=1 Tax=Lysobacter sp. TY2-98 TaxID=2290922 RepID=UPI000E203127|nr:prolyl oligopeptidase family serine peptidase [Lysobacter sp. TY2-98]AXK73315.1 S9 family peptidase [Lysobacter sp. TY2-98]
MKATSLALALALSLAALSPAHAAPTPPTIAQLAAYPAMSGFSLSPDGKHLAALQARGEDRVILVWDTDALDKAPMVIGTKNMKFKSVSFIKNDLLAVQLWQPYDLRADGVIKTFIDKLYITDLQGKQWHEPMPALNTQSRELQLAAARSSPSILNVLPNDPDHVLVVNTVGMDAGDVYKVNLHTFKADRVQRSEENAAGYVTDFNGNIRARLRSDIDGKGAYVAAEFRDPETDAWSEHFRSYVKARDHVEVVGFSEDPNIAFVLSNEGRDKAAIYEYDIKARKKGEVLFEHKFFDASSVITNHYSSGGGGRPGEVLGIAYEGPREGDIEWTAPQLKAIDAGLRQALGLKEAPTQFVDPATGDKATTGYDGDATVSLVDYSQDLKTVIASVHGPSRPPETYLLKDGKLSLLAKAYPDIDPASLGQTRLVYYKARDGLDIPAFLTTPNETMCGGGPWKAVVHPHGGPWARDAMDFDGSMWIPLMASRCMAVLRPQYRGSQGWGRKLWTAGDAQWGKAMQDDKDDGAKWLIDQKIAQPGHIAMFGFSYGGYASMAAAVRPNGLYKCAIAGAGVSDIHRIWSKFYTNPFFRQAQAPTVDGLNPLDKADQIQIPIMVYHGERDRTVPIEQSQWFVSKAKASGRPVEYHELPDYAHGPAWTRAIFADQLKLIDDYLTTGCGGGGL